MSAGRVLIRHDGSRRGRVRAADLVDAALMTTEAAAFNTLG